MTRVTSNSVEPTPEEAASFTTVDQVATWASLGVSQPATGSRLPDPVRDSLFEAFGLSGGSHVRVLALIPEEDFDDTVASWMIPSQVGDQPAAQPTHAQRAQASLFGRAARIACGTQRRFEVVQQNADLLLRTQAARGSSKGNPAPSEPSARKVKLSQVIYQTSDVEVDSLDRSDIVEAFHRYDQRLGGEPPPDHEPSMEQLTALHQLTCVLKFPPYVDFALFGPHHVRMMRKLKLTGLVMNGSGELMRTELVGPMTFGQWDACYNVFRTACIMLDIATPAALDAYRDHIRRYTQRFSEDCWALVYQADTRARRELAERIRRKASKVSGTESSVQGSEGFVFDTSQPWDFVFRMLPLQFSFWKTEVEDAALLIMTRATPRDEGLTGEAPIASRASEHVAAEMTFLRGRGQAAPGGGAGVTPKRAARSRTRLPPGQRNYDIDNRGYHTNNRQGRALCNGFNQGSCSGHVCPADPERAHQCAICLDNRHGAHNCFQNPDRQKGKGKGKGKDKGKGSKGKGSYHG